MKEMLITGIGLVSRAGITTEEYWRSLQIGEPLHREPMVSFGLDVPASRLRRMNRYSRLALYAVMEAGKTLPKKNWKPMDIGTIFSTGYGSMVSHINFCREVIKGDPDLCSPTAFAGIVPNSNVGNVCMALEMKGVSTSLLGGDNLEYAGLLISTGKAEAIFTGAVEEYCRELFCSLEEESADVRQKICEGTVMFCLEQAKNSQQQAYCCVSRGSIAGLSGFPVIHRLKEKEVRSVVAQNVWGLGREFLERVDAVFPCGNQSLFGAWEREELEKIFGKGKILKGIGRITGEALGCGYHLNLAAAALSLNKKDLPRGILEPDQRLGAVKCCLVTGYDVAGNYMCRILESW